MMISDEERRRVASNLRESRYILKPCPHGKQVISARRVASELELAHEGEYLCQNGLERLVELVDRPTCTLSEAECGSLACSNCGAAMYAPDFMSSTSAWRYCPGCGAEVIE